MKLIRSQLTKNKIDSADNTSDDYYKEPQLAYTIKIYDD